MPDDFDHLIATLQRRGIVRTLRPLDPSPRPRRRKIRPRAFVPIPDPPRARLPSLEHALRRPRQRRWAMACDLCGVVWVGRVMDTTLPASALATLAVIRVPCPVCWALAWAEADQATRAAWTRVPAWLRPRAR